MNLPLLPRPLAALALLFVFANAALAQNPASAKPAEDFPRRGLELWLKADGPNVVENGSLVQLTDMSGQANHAKRIAEQPSFPNNPQVAPGAPNGQAVWRWDGSETSYSFKRLGNIRTFFWVLKKDRRAFGPPNIRFVLGESAPGPRYDSDFHMGTHQTGLIWSATLSSPYIRGGETRLNGRLVDGTTTEMPTELAVLSVVTTGEVAADQLCRDRSLKDGRSWWGDLAEILVYNVPLSPAERASVESYLFAKYGIAPAPENLAASTDVTPRVAIADAHAGPVTSVAFSPDGQTIASAGFDTFAKLWDASGKPVRTLAGHEKRVWSVAFNPDGKSVLTGSADKTARLWDIANGQVIRTYPQDMTFWRADFSPDGKLFAAAGMPHLTYPGKTWAVLFATRSPRMFEVLDGHQANVWWVTFSRDGTMLGTASEDHTIKLWSTTGWGLLRTMDVGSNTWSFGFSPDGKMLVSSHPDGTIKIWETGTGWLRRTRHAHASAATTALYNPEGTLIASAGADGSIALHDANTGDLKARFAAHATEVATLAFSPDGKSLVSGGKDGAIKIWDVPAK